RRLTTKLAYRASTRQSANCCVAQWTECHICRKCTMNLKIWKPEGRFDSSEIGSLKELLEFLETLSGREPFYCELRQGSYKLSICIRGDLGSVQHSPADNSPPYMMAVNLESRDPHKEVEFLIGNEATPLPARYALPLAVVKQIVLHFFETGGRCPEMQWEEL